MTIATIAECTLLSVDQAVGVRRRNAIAKRNLE